MDPNILGLAGKNALVVGGGFGMGREAALLLGRAGANVMVADLDRARADAVRDEVRALGVRADATSGDVTDKGGARAVVDTAIAFHQRLDIVINIVGMAEWGDLLMIGDDVWDRQIAINLKHHIFIGTHAAQHMIDNKIDGRMAFVASVSGIYGAPFHPAYGAAKAGVMSLVRTMSQEWGPHGIRVNAVAPDVIATPRVKAGFESRGVDDEGMNKLAENELVSLARMGKPFEIAAPLVFLCSDFAGFMTGQTLIVDGGVNAAFPHAMNPFKK
jgi:NAD(P)-dependent dehydrogenase (short-subunit alcohol dehydrogenase family)